MARRHTVIIIVNVIAARATANGFVFATLMATDGACAPNADATATGNVRDAQPEVAAPRAKPAADERRRGAFALPV